jgi:DNA-binding FadR family transcriptional regulator
VPLQPVARRSLGDQVFDQLCGQILHGELPAGSALPGERALVELLGVNRQAVREAIKRLEQAQLVDVQHGGRTTVTEWRRRGSLDLLPKLVVNAEGAIDPAVVRSIMELRALIAPEVAGRCAERAVAPVTALLAELAEEYRALPEAPAVEALADLDHRLWEVLVDGSDNLAFRLAYNGFRSEYALAEALMWTLLADELSAVDLRLDLVKAVQAGDPVRARALAADLLAIGTSTVAQAMAGTAPTRRSLLRRGRAR